MTPIERMRVARTLKERAYPSRMPTEGDEAVNLNYIGLVALIKNKRASGRPKDLEDLTFLQQIPEYD